MVETHFEFQYYVTEGKVRVVLEGLEVMTLEFNSSNFSQALASKIIATEPDVFLRMASDEQRASIYAQVKERLAKAGLEVPDEILFQKEPEALRQMGQHYIKESIEASTKRVNSNLVGIMEMVSNKVLQAAFFGGANKLREIVEQPDQKYSAKEIKDAIFEDDWKLLKPLVGVKHGGKRTPKQPAFTWDKNKAQELYETVQALPRISKKPPWEYAEDQLRANDYTAETISWLQSHPAFAESPETLLKEAASIWRTHEDEGKNIPAEFRPLAFAFRHACYKLGYPEKAYNTLRTRYYEGKKTEEQGS